MKLVVCECGDPDMSPHWVIVCECNQQMDLNAIEDEPGCYSCEMKFDDEFYKKAFFIYNLEKL